MHSCENCIDLNFRNNNEINRNGNMLKYFITKNNFLSLNTHFQKKSVQLWMHKSSNYYLSQPDYVLINKNGKTVRIIVELLIPLSGSHRIILWLDPRLVFV